MVAAAVPPLPDAYSALLLLVATADAYTCGHEDTQCWNVARLLVHMREAAAHLGAAAAASCANANPTPAVRPASRPASRPRQQRRQALHSWPANSLVQLTVELAASTATPYQAVTLVLPMVTVVRPVPSSAQRWMPREPWPSPAYTWPFTKSMPIPYCTGQAGRVGRMGS